jgi:hypothetical protein
MIVFLRFQLKALTYPLLAGRSKKGVIRMRRRRSFGTFVTEIIYDTYLALMTIASYYIIASVAHDI